MRAVDPLGAKNPITGSNRHRASESGSVESQDDWARGFSVSRYVLPCLINQSVLDLVSSCVS
jgi:hypothetical protein